MKRKTMEQKTMKRNANESGPNAVRCHRVGRAEFPTAINEGSKERQLCKEAVQESNTEKQSRVSVKRKTSFERKICNSTKFQQEVAHAQAHKRRRERLVLTRSLDLKEPDTWTYQNLIHCGWDRCGHNSRGSLFVLYLSGIFYSRLITFCFIHLCRIDTAVSIRTAA